MFLISYINQFPNFKMSKEHLAHEDTASDTATSDFRFLILKKQFPAQRAS